MLGEKVTIDDSRWPVLVVTQQVAQLTDEERMDAMHRTSRLLDARPGYYAMVLDNRKAGPVPPKQRKLIAEYMEEHEHRSRTRCRAGAFVIESSIMRGVLTAILWMRRPHAETRVFGTLEEAVAWSVSMLGTHAVQSTGT